jgi:protein arginine kinase
MSESFAAALTQLGPESDVVISSRVRFARNLRGFPFTSRASSAVRQEIMRLARRAVEQSGQRTESECAMRWIDLQTSTPRDRQLLCERHLVSKHFASLDAPRALALSADEHVSMMINEEDHLRIQAIGAGACTRECFARAAGMERDLARTLLFAFHERWGFLTACPTNVGSGIRISAMLHLPALTLLKELERVKRAARELHLAVRGFHGEGSESLGDLYQFSNQTTLGSTDEALLNEFHGSVLPRLVQYEREARQVAINKVRVRMEDLVHRALATLRSARLISSESAVRDLCRVRLGVVLGLLPTNLATIQRLLLQVQPAHLSVLHPQALEGDETERELRATLIRAALG